MSKVKIIYECTKCHYEYRKWYGVCKECQSEGTITETKPVVNSVYNSSSFSMKPSEPLNINFKDITNLTPLKRNSIFVIGGEPGIGKSTLVAQICLKVEYHKVLYCTGEESIDSVMERLERIKGTYETGHIFVEYAIYIEQIQELLNRNNIDLLIIDSMHTLKSSEHTGVINICDMLRNVALKYNVAIILTSHITKDGILAGPKTIEHMVDVVFYMEGDRYGSMRTLRSVKNRFGSTSEYSMFEMTKDGLLSVNGQNRFVCKRERAVSGSILCPVIINGQIIVIEVQALVVKDSIPRVEVCGYNMNKVKMLIGVITKWCLSLIHI
jgi:DNA repair protein RadA/Sms